MEENVTDVEDSDASDQTERTNSEDPTGKPTIDEPTAPALEPEPDEFDKEAERRTSGS